MKCSLAWIFDHLHADRHATSIQDIVTTFNKKTAEIEGWYEVTVDLSRFSLARVVGMIAGAPIELQSTEWQQTFQLPWRADAAEGAWFMVVNDQGMIRFATCLDWQAEEDKLLPAFAVSSAAETAAWKKQFETHDIIIEVDNKSITNRPDMWGHRGFAREIAAIMGFELKSWQQMCVPLEQQLSSSRISATDQFPISIAVQEEQCARYAAVYAHHVQYKPSSIWMAHRLARVGAKPMNALVDVTNYVMFDVGQPMHAYDADRIHGSMVLVRKAGYGEKMTLLGNEQIELTGDDLVIADAKGAICLAGIKGGMHSGVTEKTAHVLLEAANFDPIAVRETATYHKRRTESSARFEKSVDTARTTQALERAVALLKKEAVFSAGEHQIQAIGNVQPPVVVIVSHAFIESRIGMSIDPNAVQQMLKKIEFEVSCHFAAAGEKEALEYHVVVPPFRATKDIAIPEDIVEEIARLYGYDAIVPRLPHLESRPRLASDVYRVRQIRNLLAMRWQMQDVYTYALYDESWLARLQWQPAHTMSVASPVSQNWKQLVTSLIPGLLQLVAEQSVHKDQLRFFEWARVWSQKGEAQEQKLLSGVWYDKRKPISFYEGKACVQDLCTELGLNVAWEKVHEPREAWYTPYQTARLVVDGFCIGTAGIASSSFLGRVAEGYAFFFELDGQALLNARKPLMYMPASKYPEVARDVSLFVPLAIAAERLHEAIAAVDSRICSVTLVDYFTKDEWHDKKALTLRYVIRDYEKTLTTQEADAVTQAVCDALKNQGAQIR